MRRNARVWAAASILLSGLVLLPLVGLPVEALSWQRYAGAYQPILEINYPNGGPGSFFTLTGFGFTEDTPAIILVNDVAVGLLDTDSQGNLTFILSTDQAGLGRYTVTVIAGSSAAVVFVLAPGEPIRPQEGSAPAFPVPAGIAVFELLYLPIVYR